MDAISYSNDMWGDVGGKTTADVVRMNRGLGPKQWKTFTRSDNETIFKDGLSLIEEVDFIVVDGFGIIAEQEAKGKVIRAFKDAGIDVLPDGRAVEAEWTIISSLCGKQWDEDPNGYWPTETDKPGSWDGGRVEPAEGRI